MPVLKKCPACGLYHDITVNCCSCGANMLVTQPEQVEMPPAAACGTINPDVPVYVQRCTFCGTDNFTDAIERKISRCRHCRKNRINNVTPVLWNENGQPEEPVKEEPKPEPVKEEPKPDPVPQTTSWADSLSKLGMGGMVTGMTAKAQIPEVKTEEAPKPETPKGLKVTAFGSRVGFEETFRPEDSPVLLGRYAADILNAGDARSAQYQRIERFFGSDDRISSYHCQLVYHDGGWYVRDGSFGLAPALPEKNSTNGTWVGGEKVKEAPLAAGTVIKFGSMADSLTLRAELV